MGQASLAVCSTGKGGPSTSFAVEELAELDIRIFLLVGTTGAIQPHVNIGDALITTGSARLDEASYNFAPAAYAAVADFDSASALVAAARACGARAHVGITASSETVRLLPGQFWSSFPYFLTMPMPDS